MSMVPGACNFDSTLGLTLNRVTRDNECDDPMVAEVCLNRPHICYIHDLRLCLQVTPVPTLKSIPQ